MSGIRESGAFHGTIHGALARTHAVALIMVLLVLTTLAVLGVPFVLSMTLQDRESHMFSGRVTTRLAATAARNHAIAHLRKTAYSVEWEAEAEELEAERPGSGLGTGTSRRRASLSDTRRSLRSTRSRVVRGDLGERKRRASEPDSPGRSRASDDDGLTGLHESLKVSSKGPSARDHDEESELTTELPSRIEAAPGSFRAGLAAAAPAGGNSEKVLRSRTEVASAREAPAIMALRDSRGVYAHAFISDEQGKINVNTAPPHVIGSLLGVTELALPLGPRDTKLALMDATVFRGDDDAKTLDGAVVVEHPGSGAFELITYTRRIGDELEGCFRGAFFSAIASTEEFPIGSLVYDLRGWKIGYHRLWARREGGFHPPELTRFRSLEALREIANWQTASLVLGRFRGEGLTPDFLREQGVSVSKIAELGLDPYIFLEDDGRDDRELTARFRTAERALRRRRFSARLVDRLRKARGMKVVVELAARLQGASREDVKEMEKVITQSIEGGALATPKLPRGYLREALENLALVYRTPGIETLLPEDLERLRPYVTFDSRVESVWSEGQTLTDDLIAGTGRGVRVPRGSDFNRRTVVRIRSRESPGFVEFNEVASAGPGGFELGFPVRKTLGEYDALVEALQRHPVNINTATRPVLRAVFAGLTPGGEDQVVTLYEADQLAGAVMGRRPFEDHSAFRDFLEGQAEADVIDEEDFEVVLLNAVQPTHPLLARGTVGFTYASGDVYTIESRSVLRTPGGRRVAQSQLREVIDVSAPGRRKVGLITQRDFADGAYLFAPGVGGEFPRLFGSSPGVFPEFHHRFLMSFPGVRSHLVQTRPLLLHRAPRYFPGGDPGSLRLLPSTSPSGPSPFMVGEVLSFENTYEGTELPHGEPFVTDFGAGGGEGGRAGGGAAADGAAADGAGGSTDLSTVPGGIEFWFRLRTYPEARSIDGHIVLMEAGQSSGGADGEGRNRTSLLYDQRRGAFLLRIRDASLPDPSIEASDDTGQYLELAARRPLELETWYHLRAVWDGVHGGGCQLFIDGVPAGEDNLSGELVSAIPAPSVTEPGASSIVVRNSGRFPREGVVGVGDELFEYESRSGNSLTLRQEMSYQGPRHALKQNPSNASWYLLAGEDPLFDALGLRPGAEGTTPISSGSGITGSASSARGVTTKMRGPWNRRGSVGSAHPAGARVSLHGYSREIRRKMKHPNGAETQVTGSEMVWGRGGLGLVGELPAFNFPPGVHDIFHYEINPIDVGVSQDRWLVPLFHLDGSAGHAQERTPRPDQRGVRIEAIGRVLRNLAASIPGARGARQASDYFQDRGVCVVTFRPASFSIQVSDPNLAVPAISTSGIAGGSFALFYEKQPLPPAYQKIIGAEFPHWLESRSGPLQGLRITGGYVFGGQAGGAANPAAEMNEQLSMFWTRVEELEQAYQMVTGVDPKIRIGFPVSPRSILASGEISGRYPRTGILELRGVPALWEANQGRGVSPLQDPFKTRNHPDDVVEWLRYVDIVDDAARGHLFVGRVDGTNNLRGYPEEAPRRSNRDVDRRRQLDHASGEPLRLVIELSEGGVGRGDYVSITSRDSRRAESRVHRVFKTDENIDGRFFASLMSADGNGRQGFDYSYRRDDDPRLVKFPSWALPREGSGSVVFFGTVDGAGAAPGGAAGRQSQSALTSEAGWVRPDGEDDTTGATIDEIKRFRNTTVDVNPSFGPRVRFVVAPLPIALERGGVGLASISGVIAPGRAISPANPLDVLVVSVSRERGAPSIFASGQKEGLVRIGEELFYFEDPQGQESAQPGTASFRGASPPPGTTAQPPEGQRRAPTSPVETGPVHPRNQLLAAISAANLGGSFEPEGFARLESSAPDLAGFYEVFYYNQQGGSGFQQVLRGQFGTPLLGESGRVAAGGGAIRSVTRRLRLIGRSLLGTPRQTHSLGSPIAYVPYVRGTPVSGPITNTGISVRRSEPFTRSGYLIMDPGVPGAAWEIIGHLGAAGEGQLLRARDEQGRGMLRARFGTQLRPVSRDMFAFELPYRYPDRYEPELDSESLAYLQKTFRAPGARWRAIEWRERPWRGGRDRHVDVVVLARFDGKPEWDAKPLNRPGELYLFEDRSRSRSRLARFELDELADQVEVRVHFRYRSGAYTRLGDDVFSEDWKETPILDTLHVEYEKPTAVRRHERLPF